MYEGNWKNLSVESHTDGRDGRDDLAQLELVQDGGFTGGVETNLEHDDEMPRP
jgi:hypothetical protein